MKRFLIPALSCAVLLSATDLVPAQSTRSRHRQTRVLPPEEAAPKTEKQRAKYVKAALADMAMRATSMKRRLEMSKELGSDLTGPGESLETQIHPSIAEDVRKAVGSNYMAAVASLMPRRLSPGDAGDLYVVVMLARDAVILPSSPLTLTIEEDVDSPFVFGSSEISPAAIAQFSKFFQHQLIYDDQIVFRVPVQVRPDAPAGKFTIAATVEALVHKGMDGEELGTFPATVVGMLELGDPLPDAGLMNRLDESQAEEASSSETVTDTELVTVSHTETGADPESDPGAMETPQRGALTVGMSEGLDPLGPAPGGGGSNLVLIVGGGLGLLLLLLLLVRRR